jgi:ABC-type uncharacterized transport system permease subunit
MITTTSTMAIAALIAGLGGAVSVFGSHETQDAPQPPVQQATIGGGMCAIAATFSADPVMASQIRSAAGCPQASPSR